MAQAMPASGKKSAPGGIGPYVFVGIVALLFLVNLYLIFGYAPTERVMGNVQRLFYFHVPAALVGFIALALAAASGLVYLLRRSSRWDRIAYAAVEVGTIYFTVAIITGAVWARPVWGTWWVWDANGTLSFVLWIVFIGYLIVRAYAPSPDMARRWGAVVGLVGAALVPFVYMAADWWAGLHPERVIGPGAEGSIEPAMRVTLLFSLVTFAMLFAYLVKERAGQRAMEEDVEELRQRVS